MSVETPYQFCPSCGGAVVYSVPEGDNRARAVCTRCATIHYQNPRMVVGTLPIWNQQILLCKRAIEPRLGYWTLPAGFMENGETTEQGALRETVEEAGANVVVDRLFSVIDVPHVNQVHLFYLATMQNGQFTGGSESLEVKLFELDEIPWDKLSFPTVAQTLKWYTAQHSASPSPVYRTSIAPRQRLEQQPRAAK
jgi:ADP-ribose pyrophosphatase YjhB (NUDIX family)